MDKMSSNVREYIAKRANLLGAIRLPTNSFTNTDVTTDIIFLQKREQIREEVPSWVKTEEYDEGININKYFIDHPEMVMGEFHKVSNQYGKFDFDVVNKDGNLNEMLEEAINKLPHNIFKQEEISIENVNYDSVITVRESNKVNMEDTAFWILITAVGAYMGLMCGNLVSELSSKVKKKTK